MPEPVLFAEGARPLPDAAEIAAAARAEALRRSRAVDGAIAEELLRRGWRQAGDGEGIQWCVSCGQGTVWIDPTGQPRHHACARHVPTREDGLATFKFVPASSERYLRTFAREFRRLEEREPSPEDRAARDLHFDANLSLVDALDRLEWPPSGPLIPEGVERLIVAPEWATKKKKVRKKKKAKDVIEAVADAPAAEVLDVAESAMSEPPSQEEVAEAMRGAAEAAREAAEAARDATEASKEATGAAVGLSPEGSAGSGSGVQAPAAGLPKPEDPLSSLGLPARAANALAKRGIETVGALMALTEADVASTKGLGKSSFVEVKSKLAERGIVLEPGEAPAPKKRTPKKKPTEVSIPAAPEQDAESGIVSSVAPVSAEPQAAEPQAAEPQVTEPQAVSSAEPSLADALVPEPPSFASDFADAGVDWS